MSYDIIYNKQFVQLRRTREVVPMLLAGSSNCYEIGYNGRNGRRTRSWDSMRYYNRKGKVSEKPEVILRNLNRELNCIIRQQRSREDGGKPSHIRDHFGYYASIVVGSGACFDTSWPLYRSQFVNGIRNALTIEELDKLGINLYIYAIDESPNGKPASFDIKTEQQYFAEIKRWKEWRVTTGKMFYLTFHPSNTDRVLNKLRALRRKPPKEKARVEQDHYFTLTDGYNALVKYTSRGYRYSYGKTGGKRFRTEQEAERYRQQLVNKGRYKADIWKVERVEGKCSFLV